MTQDKERMVVMLSKVHGDAVAIKFVVKETGCSNRDALLIIQKLLLADTLNKFNG